MRHTDAIAAADLVTVVIPARNEEKFIATCLASVQKQIYDNLDIVVVDGASEDRTAEIVNEIAKSDPRVRLASNPERITPVSMNVGLREARGKWLVRVDAHATVPDDYVGRAVAHLATGKWGGVGGRKDGVGLTPAGRAVKAVLGSTLGVGSAAYHYATDVRPVDHVPYGAYPVELARSLGGWDRRLKANQDFEFDWRLRAAGHQLLLDPAMRIDWISAQTVRAFYKQNFRYGMGKANVAKLHPKSMSFRHIVPPVAAAGLVVVALAGIFNPLLWLIGFAPYVLFIALATVLAAREVKPTEVMYLPGSFLALHLGRGFGFWWGLFGGGGYKLAASPS